MITAFAAHNFRSFRDTGRIALSPVTCLVGRNSSGKSSILHALMLLRQSSEYPALGARVPQLNMNGPLVEAGDFKDVVTGHHTNLPLGFVFYLRLGGTRDAELAIEPSSLVELDIPRPAGRLAGVRYLPSKGSISSHRLDVVVETQFLPQDPFGPTLSRLVIEIAGLGKATFVRTSAGQRVQHWRSYFEQLPSQSIEMLFPPAALFPYLDVRRRGRHSFRTVQFVRAAHAAFSEISRFLSEAKTVGPFRTPPARRYSFTGFGALETGITGSRAVDLLITERLLGQRGEYLRRAVTYWLKRLGLARSIDVKNLARRSNLFEVLISGAGGVPTANFADVGFGISQVLPVLVQGFLVRRGATFIVQQPELHLHPDAQAGLADFFLYLASQGVNSIVETHSEYLLVRLRRRLAEGPRPYMIGLPGERRARRSLTRRDVAVFYVRQDDSRGVIVKMPIDAAFQFEHMPPGFMNQAIEDRVALMKAIRGRG